jgi:DNA-binding Lrp family transcriptional regulator
MLEIKRIKIDSADRTILAELDKNCRIPNKRLAKLTRKSPQAVEYRIKRLQEDGVITSFNTAINPHKMGLRIYKLYFRLRNIPSKRKELYDYIKALGNVYWMGECEGAWDLIFGSFSTKTNYDFYKMKNDILSRFGSLIVEYYGDALLDVKQYPKMYFTDEIAEPTMFAGEIVENKLDKLDFEILANVVNNARRPVLEIAKEVKSTPVTVAARLKCMEELGVIIQYRIGVDLGKLGLEQYKAIIQLERYNKEDEKKLLEYISSLPNTQYYIRNLWNIEPELVVSSYQQYCELIDKLGTMFPNTIRKIDSVYMKTDQWTPGFRNIFEPHDGGIMVDDSRNGRAPSIRGAGLAKRKTRKK